MHVHRERAAEVAGGGRQGAARYGAERGVTAWQGVVTTVELGALGVKHCALRQWEWLPRTAQASETETVSLRPHHWQARAKTQSPIIPLSLPAGQAPDAETTRWWCLRLKASLDRMRRLCDSFTEAQLGLFAEPARVSEWLGADGWSARMRGCGRVMG